MEAIDARSENTAGTLMRRVFGVVTADQTRRNLAYLFVRFPLGCLYFVVFLTGIVLGLVLTPFVVGVPILMSMLAVATYAGGLEALLARRLLDRDLSFTPVDPTEAPLWPYLKYVAADGYNYLLVGFCLLSFPLGMAAFVLALVLPITSVVLVVAPLAYPLPFTHYRLGGLEPLGFESPVVIDTLPEALLASVAGFVLGIVSFHALNGAARGQAWIVERVLQGATQNR